MKTTKRILLTLIPVGAVLLLCISCKKDKPEPAKPPVVVPEPPPGQKVFVVNEGNYTQGNGSVSLYDPLNKTVDADRFGSQNGGAKLGDVPQSMILEGGKYYIVVNNSGKIVECDAAFKKTKEITGFTSPRYVLPVKSDLAYVSDMADPVIRKVNLQTGQITGTIALTAKVEKMLLVGSKSVYATSLFSEYMYVIDTEEEKVKDSVLVGLGAGGIVADKQGHLWVLATGNYNDKGGRLTRVRTSDNEIIHIADFGAADFPSRLVLSVTKDSLFYLLNGVKAVKVSDGQLPSAAMIPSGNRTFYGLGVNPRNGNIYVSDAIDYSQSSSILVYSAKGDSLTHFKAGISSTDFLFN